MKKAILGKKIGMTQIFTDWDLREKVKSVW